MKLCSTLIIILGILISGTVRCEERPTVAIGLIIPLTGSNAQIGEDIMRVAQILLPILNAKGGRFFYKARIEDGRGGLGNAAVTAGQKLINIDKTSFFITGTSGETQQIAPMAEREHLVIVASASSTPEISGLSPYVFRTYLNGETGMQQIAALIRSEKNVPVSILTEDLAFTQGYKKVLVRELGSDLAFAEDFQNESSDLRSLIIKARAARPKSWYLNCASPMSCATLVNQIRQLGIRSQIYSYFFMDNSEMQRLCGSNMAGIKYVAAPDVTDASPGFRTVLESYRTQYPGGPHAPAMARAAYDAVLALYDAIEAKGNNPVAVKDFLHGDYVGQGATGRLKFNRSGDLEDMRWIIKEIRPKSP